MHVVKANQLKFAFTMKGRLDTKSGATMTVIAGKHGCAAVFTKKCIKEPKTLV